MPSGEIYHLYKQALIHGPGLFSKKDKNCYNIFRLCPKYERWEPTGEYTPVFIFKLESINVEESK